MVSSTVIIIMTTLTMVIEANPVMTRLGLQNKISDCNDVVKVNNVFYVKYQTRNITGMPADLSVHWKTGNIFYTLISDDMKMCLQSMHTSGEVETIQFSGLGQSTVVDNLNDIVYLATDNGVYKYKDGGPIELFTGLGEDVMYLAVTNDGSTMFVATWPQNRVLKITKNGQKKETFSAIPNGHGLTIDGRNNIYFVAAKTSYILKNGNNVAIKIRGLPSDKMTGIFVSRSNKVFAMDENSNLYIIDPDTENARHVGSFGVNGVNTFGFDSADNVLIGVKGAILTYNALEENPCTY